MSELVQLAREWLDRAVGEEAVNRDTRILIAQTAAIIALAEAVEKMVPPTPPVRARAPY